MDFTYDDEQQALAEAVRGLFTKAYGDFENRRQATGEDPGFSEKTWQQMAEMGLLGLPFPEEVGGMGAGPIEVGLVATEMGRVLAPEPFLAAVVLAGGLVAASGTAEQQSEVLTALGEGALVPAFAHAEPRSRWRADARSVTASGSGKDWTLDGVKEPVAHGARADLLVVSAALPDGGGTGLFLVQPDADGLERTGYRTHDGARAARVSLSGTPAAPLGEPGADRTHVIGHVLDIARVTACAEALGLMQGGLASTTEYLKSRKQFGVTLNTFQALKFRAADLYVATELTTSLVLWATMLLAAGDHRTAAEGAARAGLQTSRAGRQVLQEAIQLHGGIGMTAEYSVGHRLSRLTALEELLGTGDVHLRALASSVASHGEVDPLP